MSIISSQNYAQLRDVQSIYCVIREYGCHLELVAGMTNYSALSHTIYSATAAAAFALLLLLLLVALMLVA